MAVIRPRNLLLEISIASALLFPGAAGVAGQNLAKSAVSNPAPAENESDVRALAQSVRELQAQVQALTSEVSALRTAAGDRTGNPDLPPAALNASPATPGARDIYSVAASRPVSNSSSQATASAPVSIPQDRSIEDRLSQVEENQDLAASNLQEQSQTKIESGSKYRVRLSGIVLLNMFGVRGNLDSQDVPEIAVPQRSFESVGSLGG